MRTYGQYCALARSLDVVGDRWTLLIIRELFARDSRYSDLRDGLPGIATNLLADRLKQLRADCLVESYEAPPPVRATVYRLTSRGRQLGPVLKSLVQWGTPLLDEDREDDEFRPQWLMLALRILYQGVDVEDIGPLSVVYVNQYEPATVDVRDSEVEVYLGSPSSDLTVELEGHPGDVYSFLSGAGSTDRVLLRGDDDDLRRLQKLIVRVGDLREQHSTAAV